MDVGNDADTPFIPAARVKSRFSVKVSPRGFLTEKLVVA